jgi:ATP-binding cassette subfamily F protein 3
MSLVTMSGVRLSYPGKVVLDGVDWELNAGQKVGLIGPNGAGKTTLFRLVVGELRPDAGQVHRGRGARIGYLRQSASLEPDRSLFDAMLVPFAALLAAHDRLRALEARMAAGGDDEALLDEYGRLQERYEREGGYSFEAELKATLFGLGFGAEDFDRPCGVLSGGEKGRAQLAQLLLSKPDLLLLDEPTNHLDIAATEWLEGYLSGFPGALCVVSHDRWFLDRVVYRIAELEQGRLTTYVGNYSAYLPEKARRLEAAVKSFEVQQAFIARTEEFIRRNIAGQKTRQAKSRRKMLAKLERVDRPGGPRRDVGIALDSGGRSGREVLALRGVSFAFPGSRGPLLEGVDLVLERGDRVGIVGPNGSGKSTLLKLLAGELRPTRGDVAIGERTRIGYYDQEFRRLDRGARVIDEVWSVAPRMEAGPLRDFLARFLFTGDDVFRTVGSLSGGEQSRVALAKLMLNPANCLLLDEPTNHLDIPTVETLEAALADYDGTLAVVSHDRYFLEEVVDEIALVEGGRVTRYLGTYGEFAEKRQAERAAALAAGGASAQRGDPGDGRPDGGDAASAWAASKAGQRAARARARRIEALEKELAALDAEAEATRAEMTRPELAADWAKLGELQARLDGLARQWAERAEEMERLEADGERP